MRVTTIALDELLKNVIMRIASGASFASKCWIVSQLEKLCNLTHFLHAIEYKLTGKTCNLALASCYLDEEWGTGQWKPF